MSLVDPMQTEPTGGDVYQDRKPFLQLCKFFEAVSEVKTVMSSTQ